MRLRTRIEQIDGEFAYLATNIVKQQATSAKACTR